MPWWRQIVEKDAASLVGVAVVVVGVAALSHVWAMWSRRRSTGAPDEVPAGLPEPTPPRRLVRRSLRAMLPPALLLMWAHALWAAGELLLSAAEPSSLVDVSGVALGWSYRLGVFAAITWALAAVGGIVDAFLVPLSARTETTWDDIVLPHAGKAARYGLPLLAVILATPTLSFSPALSDIVQRATSVLLIGFVAFVLCQIVDAAATFVTTRHRIDVSDNLNARAILTQVVVLKKVAITVIGLFTVASTLMVFDSVRQFGASILASAGVAGIVVGFAAQRSIATLLAGFQIALTQPIRVDDVVIVEGEWGRIEDITLTYVVVCIWDLRRLVVPITYFIEQPFQNWTRTSAALLSTVLVYVDYTVPVDALRAELSRILASSPFWDGKTNVLQVTDSKEHTLEVRALASAADASKSWDLRCEIREKLVAFIQRRYPQSLPHLRAVVDGRLGEVDTGTPQRVAAG
jgi:small-conductance mechanosensitive channel